VLPQFRNVYVKVQDNYSHLKRIVLPTGYQTERDEAPLIPVAFILKIWVQQLVQPFGQADGFLNSSSSYKNLDIGIEIQSVL
jgi:hypothetical protein